MFVALITKEYVNGRVAITTDRLGGFRTGHGSTPVTFWRQFLQWSGQKFPEETIHIGVIKSTETYYENYLDNVEDVTYQQIDTEYLKTFGPDEFDLIYFIGLPEEFSDEIPDILETYVSNSGGLVFETPDIEGEIQLLSSIDSVVISSTQRPSYEDAFWTAIGFNSELYAANFTSSFMTTIDSDDIPSDWNILMSNIETITIPVDDEDTLDQFDFDNSSIQEFGMSFVVGMKDGLVTIFQGVNDLISTSSSLSDSSSSTVEDTEWDICSNIVGYWKLNESNANAFLWDSSGDFAQIGSLKKNGVNTTTASKSTIGKVNNAISFDPSDMNNVEIAAGTKLNFVSGGSDEPFSVALWVKPTDIVGTEYLVSKDGAWDIALVNDTVEVTLINGINTRKMVSSSSILSSSWNFVTVTYDGSSLAIYVKNVDVSGAQVDAGYTNMSNSNSKTFLGASSVGDYLDGVLDNVLVVDKVFNLIEREGMYNTGRGTEECIAILAYTSSSSSSSSSIDSSSSTSSGGYSSSSSSSGGHSSSSSSSSSEMYSESSSSSSEMYSESSSTSSGGYSESSSSSSLAPIELASGESIDVDSILGAGHYGRVQITYTGGTTPPNADATVTVNGISYKIANVAGDFVWDYDNAQGGIYTFVSIGESIDRTAAGRDFKVEWDGFGSLVFTVDIFAPHESESSSSSSSEMYSESSISSSSSSSEMYSSSSSSSSSSEGYSESSSSGGYSESSSSGGYSESSSSSEMYSESSSSSSEGFSSSSSSSSEGYSESSSSSEMYSESSSSEMYSESSSSGGYSESSSSSNNDNLVGRYTFEEGAGTLVADSSPNGNDGTAIGGMTWATGKCGSYAGDFDGIDDYVDLGVAHRYTGELSISCWVKLNSLANYHTIINGGYYGSGSLRDGYLLQIAPGGAVSVRFFDGPDWSNYWFADTSTTISVGEWTHVVIVRDPASTTSSLYFNGVEASYTQNSKVGSPVATTYGNSGNTFIGTDPSNTYPLNGELDDLRFYDKILSQSEIYEIYAECDNSSSSNSGGYSSSSSSLDSSSSSSSSEMYSESSSSGGYSESSSSFGYSESSSSSSEGFSSESSSSIGDALLARYEFEEGAGTLVADSSVNGYDGTATGGMTWEEGKCKAYSGGFNGSSEVGLPSIGIDNSDDPFSIMGWAKISGSSGYRVIISCSSSAVADANKYNVQLRIEDSNNKIYANVGRSQVADVSILSDETITVGAWTHVALTYDGSLLASGLKLYINGVLSTATVLGTAVLGNATDDWVIGDFAGQPLAYGKFIGDLDDIRIYNIALPDSEINGIMNDCNDYSSSSSSSSSGGYSESSSSEMYSESSSSSSSSGGYSESSSSEGYSESSSSSGGYSESSSSGGYSESSSSSLGNNLIAKYTFEEGTGTLVADSSANGNDGTAIGGMTWGAGKCGSYAGDFDGTNDYVTIPDSISLDFSASYTISGWFNHDGVANGTILGKGISDAQEELRIILISDGSFYFDTSSYYQQTAASVITANVWNHFAVSKVGNTLKGYLNGTLLTWSAGGIQTSTNDTASLFIGRDWSGSYFSGSIDDIRIFDRVLSISEVNEIMNDCEELSSDSSSSEGYSESSSSEGYSESSSDSTEQACLNTKLLLHMDGTNGSTNFKDESDSQHAITAYGDAQISDAQSKFGGLSYSGSWGGEASISTGASSDFDFGTGDFTVDGWYRFNSLANDQSLWGIDNAEIKLLYVNSTDKLQIYTQGSGTPKLIVSSGVSINVWYHFSVVRKDGTITLYRDGTSLGSFAETGSLGESNTGFAVGSYQSGGLATQSVDGYIDELRVLNGIAAWTSDFTPPTAPYSCPDESSSSSSEMYSESSSSSSSSSSEGYSESSSSEGYSESSSSEGYSESSSSEGYSESSSSSEDYSESSSSEGYSESSSSSEMYSESSSSSESIDDGLVAKYNFEEGMGTLVADSAGSNDATATSMTWGEGKCGNYAGSFDGANDVAKVGSAFSGSLGSVTAWVNPSSYSSPGNGTILCVTNTSVGTNYWHFRIEGGGFGAGKLIIAQRNNDVADVMSGGNIPLGTWTHVAVVSNGMSYSLYINGIEQSLTLEAGSNSGDWFNSVSGANQSAMGSFVRTSNGDYLDGLLDDVRVFNRALTADQLVSVMGDCPDQVSSSSSSEMYSESSSSSEMYSESSSSEMYSESSSSSEGYSESSSSSSSSIDDNLVARYEFEEGAGTLVSDSGANNYDGTAVGGMTWPSGKCSDYSGGFDGTNDYVGLPDIGIDNTDDPFSISCWLKPSGTTGSRTVVACGSTADSGKFTLILRIDPTTNLVRVSLGNAQVLTLDILSDSGLPTGSWIHVTLTYDGSLSENGLSLYFNGLLTDITLYGSATTSLATATDDWVIAARGGSELGTTTFAGDIDDVRIYDKVLIGSEIYEIYAECDNSSSSSSSEEYSESSSSEGYSESSSSEGYSESSSSSSSADD